MITINKWKLANSTDVKKSHQILFDWKEAILALQAVNFFFFFGEEKLCKRSKYMSVE